jgi:tellurite resistance protein TehA-like permease
LGFWFLPPVGLFVLVFAGNFLAMRMENIHYANVLLVFNVVVLGVAILLTAMVYTFFMQRSFFYNFPRKDVAPSFMIGVAPLGVSIIAINTILPLIAKVGIASPDLQILTVLIKGASLLLWGFGLWWLIMASLLTMTYFFRGGVPVTLGYWAFIFPPAAYTIASLIVANSLNLMFVKYVAIVLAVGLLAAWIVILVLTIRGMIDRSIFDVSPTFKGDIPYL